MLSMGKQQQRMSFHGGVLGLPSTGVSHTAGTPVGFPRFPGVTGTPRFPPLNSLVYYTLIQMMAVPPTSTRPAQVAHQESRSADKSQQAVQGLQPSQHSRDCDTPTSIYRLTSIWILLDYIMWLQRAGGGVGGWCWGDFLEEITSFISMDILKDKIWEMQCVLNAVLKYFSRVATSDDIMETHLCHPFSSQCVAVVHALHKGLTSHFNIP